MKNIIAFLFLLFSSLVSFAQEEFDAISKGFHAESIFDFDYDLDDGELFLRPAMCEYGGGILVCSGIIKDNIIRLKYFKEGTNEVKDIELKYPRNTKLYDKVFSIFFQNDLFVVHTFEMVSFFDAKWNWISSKHISENISRIVSNDTLIIGWEVNNNVGSHPDLNIVSFNEKFEVAYEYKKEIKHSALCQYSVGELVILCGDAVVYSDLDSPNFYLLNAKLELTDSLSLIYEGWKRPDDFPDILPIDILSVRTYMEDKEGCQINGLGALNDSTFLVSGRTGTMTGEYWKIGITNSKLSLLSSYSINHKDMWYMNEKTIDVKKLEPNDICFMQQLRMGVMINGKHYVISDLEPGFIGKTWNEYQQFLQFPSRNRTLRSSLIISSFNQ
jgi:hypothetical protein